MNFRRQINPTIRGSGQSSRKPYPASGALCQHKGDDTRNLHTAFGMWNPIPKRRQLLQLPPEICCQAKPLERCTLQQPTNGHCNLESSFTISAKSHGSYQNFPGDQKHDNSALTLPLFGALLRQLCQKVTDHFANVVRVIWLGETVHADGLKFSLCLVPLKAREGIQEARQHQVVPQAPVPPVCLCDEINLCDLHKNCQRCQDGPEPRLSMETLCCTRRFMLLMH